MSREDAQAFLDSNCYDIFSRASALNFAAVSNDGIVLASAGASVFNNVVSFHHLCCNASYVSLDVLASIVKQSVDSHFKGMQVQVKQDARWPFAAEDFKIQSCTAPARWTIDCSTWRRKGICKPEDRNCSNSTFITDCGQLAYAFVK